MMISNLVKYRTKKDTFLLIWSAIVFFCLGWFICYKIVNHSPCPTPELNAITNHDSSMKTSTIDLNSNIITANTVTSTSMKSAYMTSPSVNININMPVGADTTNLDMMVNKFEKTMRSCLGAKCFDEAVNGIDRVGILAPPHSGGELLTSLLRSRISNDKVTITYDTHVPAYGYGKNHGWTRIIRIVRPIVDHSLSFIAQPLSSKDMEVQVKQLMRWHCRVSHVAAHTKLLTIFTDDMIRRPMVEIEKMLTFVGSTYDRHALISDDNALLQALQAELHNSSYRIIAANQHIIDAASYALDAEMNATKFLTKWPCPSFRGLERDYKDVSLSLPAALLSANCSDPYVTCSVHYDQNGG